MKPGRSLPKTLAAILLGWLGGTFLSALAMATEPQEWSTHHKQQCEEILRRELETYDARGTDPGTAYHYCRLASQAHLPPLAYTGCVVDLLLELRPQEKYAAPYYCLDPRVEHGHEFRRRVRTVSEAFQVDPLNGMALVIADWDRNFDFSSCANALTAFAQRSTSYSRLSPALAEFRTFALNLCREKPVSAENFAGMRDCLAEMDRPTIEAFGLPSVARRCVENAANGYLFAYCFTYAVPNGCSPAHARARDLGNLETYCAHWERGDEAPECPGLPPQPPRED